MRFFGHKHLVVFLGVALLLTPFAIEAQGSTTVSFDYSTLPTGVYYDIGQTGAGGFASENFYFENTYSTAGGTAWSQWGLSKIYVTDPPNTSDPVGSVYATGDQGYLRREMGSKMTNSLRGGYNETAKYAVAHASASGEVAASINFQAPVTLSKVYLTNTNFAYFTMLNGDDNYINTGSDNFGDAGDTFYVTITGYDIQGNVTGTVNYNLATASSIVSNWNAVDLAGLGSNVKKVTFSLTDTSDAKVPLYFAMDSLTISGNPLGQTWTGGGTNANLSNAANWGGTAPLNGESFVLDGTTKLNVVNDFLNTNTSTFGALTFGTSAASFTVSGNALKLKYDVANMSDSTQTINNKVVMTGGRQSIYTAGGNIIVDNEIAEEGGSYSLTKTGSHTLILGATNTYTGATNIENGILELTTGGQISASSGVTIADGAELLVHGGVHSISSVSGAGDIVVDAVSGTLLSITGSSNLTGSITVMDGGGIVFGSAYSSSSAPETVPEPGFFALILATTCGSWFFFRRK